MNNTQALNVINNKERSRFEIQLSDDYAFVEYGWRNEVFELQYIFVPVAFRGKGIAEQLIKYVLDDVVSKNLKVIVYCSWIAGYIRSHPEYHSLMYKNFR